VFSEYRTLVLLTPVEVCANFDDLAAVLERIDGTMAWAGASEVAKGLHSGIRAARELGADTRLVFVSDGHEAPPLHPRYLPRFDGRPGEVPARQPCHRFRNSTRTAAPSASGARTR
jgi:mxaL protein